jgi:hypothetical protein
MLDAWVSTEGSAVLVKEETCGICTNDGTSVRMKVGKVFAKVMLLFVV